MQHMVETNVIDYSITTWFDIKHIGMHKFIIDNFLSSLVRIGLLLFRAYSGDLRPSTNLHHYHVYHYKELNWDKWLQRFLWSANWNAILFLDLYAIHEVVFMGSLPWSTSAWALTFYIFIRYHHIPLCDVQGNHLKIIRWTWGSLSSDMHLDGSHPSVAANVCMQHIPHLHCKMWTPQFRTLWSRTQSGFCRLLSLHWT